MALTVFQPAFSVSPPLRGSTHGSLMSCRSPAATLTWATWFAPRVTVTLAIWLLVLATATAKLNEVSTELDVTVG